MDKLIKVRVIESVKGKNPGDIIEIKAKDLAILESYVKPIFEKDVIEKVVAAPKEPETTFKIPAKKK